MKNVSKNGLLAIVIVSVTLLSSCKEYRMYDDKEIIENSFTGTINGTTLGEDPYGDFTGGGDSGTYSFIWINPQQKASANFDITTNTGSVQMILNDAKGKEVLNVTRSAGSNDTFSGVSEEGKEGKWLVTLVFTDFNGDGSYSIHPGN